MSDSQPMFSSTLVPVPFLLDGGSCLFYRHSGYADAGVNGMPAVVPASTFVSSEFHWLVVMMLRAQ